MDGGAFDSYRVCEAMGARTLASPLPSSPPSSAPTRSSWGRPRSRSEEWLGAIAEQGVVFAYGATEPEAGSDLEGDDHHRGTDRRRKLEGRTARSPHTGSMVQTQWISNGSIADFSTILAATPEGRPGSSSRRTPRPAPGRRRTSTGCACQPAPLFLDDVVVPAHYLIGPAGQGPDPGAAGLWLHPVDGCRLRARWRLGGTGCAIAYSRTHQGGGPLRRKQGFPQADRPHAVPPPGGARIHGGHG